MMDSNAKLIDDLIQAAYDSGYYSGGREDGQPHHLAAMKERGRLRDEALQRLAALPDLLAELSLIVEGWDAIESNKIRQLSDWELERREFARAALAGAHGAEGDPYPAVDDGGAWGGSPDGWPD